MPQPLTALSAETQDRTQELLLLYDVAMAMSQSLDLEPILETALDIVIDRLDMAAGTIYLFDEEQQRFIGRAHRGLTMEQQRKLEHFQHSIKDFVAEIVANGRMEYEADASKIALGRLLWNDPQRRSMAALPLMARGKVIGAIGITSKPDRQFSTRGAETLLAVGQEIGIAIENALLIAQVRRGEEEAQTLYQVGMDISASLDLKRVLEVVATGARQLLQADIGAVGLLEEERREIVIQAAAGAQPRAFLRGRFSIQAGKPGAILARGEPLISQSNHPDLPMSANLADADRVGTLMVPLLRSGHLVGALIALARRRRFTQREAQLLARLASQSVLSIENAQLYQQVRHVAALEERDRLARELHDSLAQTLSYLSMQASLVSELLAAGQIASAQASLQELSETAQAAYADVHEAIFNLRTTIPSGLGLLATLRTYLAEYRLHSGLDAQLIVDDENLADLPTGVAAEVIRIIQEALTNVRKHARASRVWVRFQQKANSLYISIEDDGVGFDPAQIAAAGRRSFGLQVMRERAESIGATLTIVAQPGCGTQIGISFPPTDGASADGTPAGPAGR